MKIRTDWRMMQTLAPPRRKVKIFGLETVLWTVYLARLAFRDKLIGGIPKDPKLIEGWLRTKAGIEDPQELRAATLRTLAEVGADMGEVAANEDDGGQAATALLTQKRTTGFKSGLDGLYVEGRQVKAMLKESTNVVFAGERWGPTKKAAKSFFAERVFIEPDKLTLGVQEPTGVETGCWTFGRTNRSTQHARQLRVRRAAHPRVPLARATRLHHRGTVARHLVPRPGKWVWDPPLARPRALRCRALGVLEADSRLMLPAHEACVCPERLPCPALTDPTPSLLFV